MRRLHDPDAKPEGDTETKTQRETRASDHSTEVTQDVLKYLTIISQGRNDREHLSVSGEIQGEDVPNFMKRINPQIRGA